jgi:hypothetical protein
MDRKEVVNDDRRNIFQENCELHQNYQSEKLGIFLYEVRCVCEHRMRKLGEAMSKL